MNTLKPRKSYQCVDTPERINFLSNNCDVVPKAVDVLGRGGFGIVLKATYRGKTVAVKVVHLKHEHCRKSLENEKHILEWKHPNIIGIFKVVADVSHGLVIMERIIGENLQIVLNSTSLSTFHAIEILTHVAQGLTYCHKQGVTHGDIKPQNILVTLGVRNRKYLAKLCDFGSSWRANKNQVKDECHGTIRYMAPEALKGIPFCSKVDIFSFGVTMWQIEQRKIPYEEIYGNDVIAYRVVREGLRPDAKQESLNVPNILLNDIRSISPRKIRSDSLLGRNDENCTQNVPRNLPMTLNALLKEASIENHEEILREKIHWRQIFKHKKWTDDPRIIFKYRSLFRTCWHEDPSCRPEASQIVRELKKFSRKAHF